MRDIHHQIVMTDRNRKEQTPPPPPLLLMPAGGGLTLNAPSGSNVLMPVIQAEASLFGPDEGEVDSFLGQSPPTQSQASTYGYFQQQNGTASDPFAHVGQHSLTSQAPLSGPGTSAGIATLPTQTPLPASLSYNGAAANISTTPTSTRAGPPESSGSGSSSNIYRQQGPMRYASPSVGTYASPSQNTYQPPPPPYSQPGIPLQSGITSPISAPTPPPPYSASQIPDYQQQQQQHQYQQQQFVPGQAGIPEMASMPPVSVSSTSVKQIYEPVQPHWCYCKMVETKEVWFPFSLKDSLRLEEAFHAVQPDPESLLIATDGDRYDVNLYRRTRYAVYWEEHPVPVRRCSWFFKREGDSKYVPYEEEFATKLEEEYKNAVASNTWHKRLEFPGSETIVMHSPNVIVHFHPASQPDEWGNVQSVYSLPGDQMRPRVVKRGVEDFASISDGESSQIDHLVFVVHGIGPVADIRFRNIAECVDDFRSISLSLLGSHFKQYQMTGQVGRVEFLPVFWYKALHGETTGIDKRLKGITIRTTLKLRQFVNDTLLDILFYTSPTYCQTITGTTANEINRLYQLFLSRNPTFKGSLSVAGHSLGSSVLFDVLSHQRDNSSYSDYDDTSSEPSELSFSTETDTMPDNESDVMQPDTEESGQTLQAEPDVDEELSLEELLAKVGLQDKLDLFTEEQIDMEALAMCSDSDLKDLGLPMGPRKKLQGIITEENEKKNLQKKEAELRVQAEKARLIAEREEFREDEKQRLILKRRAEQFRARGSISVEYLMGMSGTGQPMVKYPQLDFAPSALFALGSPIGVFLAVRGIDKVGETYRLPTCPKVFNIFHPYDPVAYRLEPLVNPSSSEVKPVLMPHHKGRKRLHLELKDSLARVGTDLKQRIIDSLRYTWSSLSDFARSHRGAEENLDKEVDNVIQEMTMKEEEAAETGSTSSNQDEDIFMGQLNGGRRIDYMLQEKPIESFNEYLFALATHTCYWESEDTVLMVLKELYAPMGITPIMPGPEGHPRIRYQYPPTKSLVNPPVSTGAGMSNTPSGPPPESHAPPSATPHVSFASNPVVGPVHNIYNPTGAIQNGNHHVTSSQAPPHPPTAMSSNMGPPPLSGFVRTKNQ